ncbi:MAG: hypothetical protein ACI8ZM_000714 [Crocinitomix sp.]|jgi:hypothetical protein
MSLKPSDSLAICKKCKNRSFDKKIGLICSITNDQRLFLSENDCTDYIADTAVIANDKHKAKKKRREVLIFLIVGGISTIIGVLATTVLLLNDRISIWIIALLLIGLSLLAHGYIMKKNIKNSC